VTEEIYENEKKLKVYENKPVTVGCKLLTRKAEGIHICQFCSGSAPHDSRAATPRADSDIWVGLQDVSSSRRQILP